MNRQIQNTAVLLAAASAALAIVQTQTHWLSGENNLPARERCYGVARIAGNDCATPKHSCAAQSTKERDIQEWIMLPKGLCDKLTGSVTESL